jgi:hypothetical protein
MLVVGDLSGMLDAFSHGSVFEVIDSSGSMHLHGLQVLDEHRWRQDKQDYIYD